MPDNRPTSNIQSIDDARMWMIDHDARIDVWWEIQHKLNAKVEEEMGSLGLRISACEKKLMLIAGAASAVGGLVGGLLAKWFGG